MPWPGMGLAGPPSLKVIQPAGRVPPYKPTSNREGWAGETDLDVEYAHTIAPGASILMVETPTAENEGTTGFPQIVIAEKYVINHHLGGVISQSFSATEQTFGSRQAVLRLREACSGSADMYQSFGGQPAGWYPTCGTSEATPEFAGIVTLADQVAGRPLGVINSYLYRLSAQRSARIVDVVSGDNAVSFTQGGKLHTVHGFAARRGYDLAPGAGTVNGLKFVRELAQAANRHHSR